jgi:hypothetical protein
MKSFRSAAEALCQRRVNSRIKERPLPARPWRSLAYCPRRGCRWRGASLYRSTLVSSERLRSVRRPLPFRGGLARIRLRGPCSSRGRSSRDDNVQYTAIRDGLTSVYESAANTSFWLSYALSRQGSIWIVAPKVVGSSRVGNELDLQLIGAASRGVLGNV